LKILNHREHRDHREDLGGDISEQVIGCALRVHQALGPGLLETAYSSCLAHELSLSGLHFEKEKGLPISYRGTNLDCGFRLDFLVADQLVLEVKAVERLLPVHEAQLLTYLRLSDKRLGLLINFNVPMLKHGIRRIAN
jgi:GxxExxY protein